MTNVALSVLRMALVSAVSLCLLTQVARAEERRLDPILAVGDAEPRTLAVGEALRESSTPKSLLGDKAIHEIATPFADYATLAKLTPSYVDSAPNGEGFDAAKNQSLRGFTDTQFTLTVDGIPLQDPDTFGHHSTSYFPAATLEQLVVDRSPGGAADAGYATVGGTLQLSTLGLGKDAGTQVFGSYGSFATSVIGARYTTGRPTAANESGLLINLEHLQTAGALSNADGRRDDLLLKGEWLLAGDLRLTGLYTFDRYHFNNPPNTTTANLATLGASYGFSASPARADFYGNARTDRRADFGYVRLQGNLDDNWAFDSKVYTYLYANAGYGLNGDESRSPMPTGFGVPTTDIAGRFSTSEYRTVGTVQQFSHIDAQGVLRAGLWLDHSRLVAARYAIDLTRGTLYNANSAAASPVYFRYVSHLDTVQPFAEYQWQVTDWLRVRPGLRYQQVRRGYSADVNQNFRPGTPGEVTRMVSSTLPSLDANLRLDANTSFLAQVSRGVQVPGQALFYNTNTPALTNQAQAQRSTAWQLGLVRETTGYDLGLTAYLINFSNYITTTTQNGITVSTNSGDVRYRGLEAEGRVDLGLGVGLVGNASLIRGEYQTAGIAAASQVAGADVPLVPTYTGLIGLVYGDGDWQASLLGKFVGVEYQGTAGSTTLNRRVEPYSYTDFTLTRMLGPLAGLQRTRVTLGINNLQDKASITDNAGPAALAAAGSLINTLPRRSFTLSLVADL